MKYLSFARNMRSAAGLLAMLLVVLALVATPVAAGRVRNNTPWAMRYTKNPNASGAPHRCRFWNWWTPTSPLPRDQTVSCTQLDLRPNGGNSEGDADGFTFPDKEYWVNGARKQRGVWTKITDINFAYCEDSFGQAWCLW